MRDVEVRTTTSGARISACAGGPDALRPCALATTKGAHEAVAAVAAAIGNDYNSKTMKRNPKWIERVYGPSYVTNDCGSRLTARNNNDSARRRRRGGRPVGCQRSCRRRRSSQGHGSSQRKDSKTQKSSPVPRRLAERDREDSESSDYDSLGEEWVYTPNVRLRLLVPPRRPPAPVGRHQNLREGREGRNRLDGTLHPVGWRYGASAVTRNLQGGPGYQKRIQRVSSAGKAKKLPRRYKRCAESAEQPRMRTTLQEQHSWALSSTSCEWPPARGHRAPIHSLRTPAAYAIRR
ncbi:unnamed protein product [Rangifer tarandus platyrhynchus]|uniref:Uncharacterized protein n=1 Tax=Rangifer tarandus platyrhynchus TaxID=3082113 RepID=A0ABN8XNV7_RANTA|nr:unnamed protein product [Rangifer tarandus platyrhynchus]